MWNRCRSGKSFAILKRCPFQCRYPARDGTGRPSIQHNTLPAAVFANITGIALQSLPTAPPRSSVRSQRQYRPVLQIIPCTNILHTLTQGHTHIRSHKHTQTHTIELLLFRFSLLQSAVCSFIPEEIFCPLRKVLVIKCTDPTQATHNPPLFDRGIVPDSCRRHRTTPKSNLTPPSFPDFGELPR